MGEGAGADIATRFAMNYPSRVWGVVLIHSHRNTMMSGLNLINVEKYDESYRKKEVWSMRMSTETLILVGAKTKPGTRNGAVKKSENLMKKMGRGLCSIIRLADVEDVLEEVPDQAADAIILFCQGFGLLSAIQRKSRQNRNMKIENKEERVVSVGYKDSVAHQ